MNEFIFSELLSCLIIKFEAKKKSLDMALLMLKFRRDGIVNSKFSDHRSGISSD